MPNPGISQIFDIANQSVFINQTTTNMHNPGMDITMVALVVLPAILFCTLAFWAKIRNEDGEVNPTRMGFCILGAVFNGFAAWLTISVTIPVGCSGGVYLNQTVSICQNITQEGGPIPYLFLLASILCLANGIYLNILPEMIKPELNAFRGPVSTKTQAEKDYERKRKKAGIAEDDLEDDE